MLLKYPKSDILIKIMKELTASIRILKGYNRILLNLIKGRLSSRNIIPLVINIAERSNLKPLKNKFKISAAENDWKNL